MCGIVGYWNNDFVDVAIAKGMANKIQHRGPDDGGVWCDKTAGLAMAHRRLSIIDLSPAGHQPMISPCKRYVLIYNGEIYNHQELRKELDDLGDGFDWRGHSDTETLLAALRHWGIEKTLQKLNGMFAFALWDSVEKKLFLARDRMGEKPLYYGINSNNFLFGSELKGLTAHPDWKCEINRDALALFMRHNYIPSPWSIYTNILKLPPAHFVVISNFGKSISNPICYWDLKQIIENKPIKESKTADEWVEELNHLLLDSVKRRMVSDVPLGAFLSGGLDSSMVVAAMQAQSERPVQTFSIGFHEDKYNEAHYAKAVAKHLGTDHTELYVTPQEALDVIPNLPEMWDEPFSDSSQIPTFLVSKLAKRHVTVSLSGDGGDELFCGYNRYFLGSRIWNKLRLFPLSLRKVLSKTLSMAPGHQLEYMQGILPKGLQVSNLADRIPKLAEVLNHRDCQSFYRQLVSHWKKPEQLVLGSIEPRTLFNSPNEMPTYANFHEMAMYLDTKTYLPGDILTKVDRASMAVSLEARVPLLDHRLVEFAWEVPSKYKYRNGQGKWLLKQVLYRYIPRELMERPKMGFGVPIEQWLRGPLKDWGEEFLSEKRLREDGFFNPKPIRKMWEEHVSGKRRWHYYLWDVLMFQAWAENLK
ncbi:MAG: asparagine synthase (glutamine-hydrolyzing) [Nitrospinae bacterium]|nr:asparagine synthase (glutamine-hydrolyzing) [Nitrospinota bacterium]